ALTATRMTFANVALRPTVSIANHTASWTAPSLTVTASDLTADNGSRMGGDTINVCQSTALAYLATACATVNGGPGSPLVIYGDTSQDGTWYAGQAGDSRGYEFGPKPFDPFTYIPDAQNEDDEWVFGLADSYQF